LYLCVLYLCVQASVNGHTKVVELLLAGGADPLLQNKEGRSAVDMAKTPELAQQLKAHTTPGSS
jgi:ankyrin repeat protein